MRVRLRAIVAAMPRGVASEASRKFDTWAFARHRNDASTSSWASGLGDTTIGVMGEVGSQCLESVSGHEEHINRRVDSLATICERAILESLLDDFNMYGPTATTDHYHRNHQAHADKVGAHRPVPIPLHSLPVDVAPRILTALLEMRALNAALLFVFAGMEVQTLELSAMSERVTDPWMGVLATMQVHSLDLSGCLGISNEGFDLLCFGDPLLSALDTEACSVYVAQGSSVSSEAVAPLDHHLLSCPMCVSIFRCGETCLRASLRELNLSGLHSLSSAQLERIAVFNRLEKLVLDECTVTNVSLAFIAQKVTGLVSLSLVRCDRLSGAGLECIATMRALRKLDLSGCARLSGESMKPLARLNGTLSELSLRGCVKLNSIALQHIGSIQSLRTLDLNGCHRIDDDGFRHLANLENLEFLCLTDTRISDDALVHLFSRVGHGILRIHLTRCGQLRTQALCDALGYAKRLEAIRLRTLSAVNEDVLRVIFNSDSLRNSLVELDICDARNVNDGSFEEWANADGIPADGSANQETTQSRASCIFAKLEKLYLRGTNVTGSGIARIVRVCPKLKVLDISGCGLVDAMCIRAIAEHCAQLRELQLNDCATLLNDSLLPLGLLSDSLETLSLERCAGVSNSGMRTVCQLKRLKALSLAFTSVGDAGVALVCQLRCLKLLNVKGLAGISISGARSIANCLLLLENLNLSGCRNLCDAACLVALKRLKRLSLHNCCELTDTGIRTLGYGLPMLEFLNLRGCRRVSEACVVDLWENTHVKTIGCDFTRMPKRSSDGMSAALVRLSSAGVGMKKSAHASPALHAQSDPISIPSPATPRAAASLSSVPGPLYMASWDDNDDDDQHLLRAFNSGSLPSYGYPPDMLNRNASSSSSNRSSRKNRKRHGLIYH
ncbi:F-box/LRR-repeat protein 4 [Porphyridium purpureum]|uniref:F-box/LRR-repeat protein 4 n=1 Tax=Porphyridium purpureum TaxID=35688 RepID=A0A5J4Z2Y5_PORPP|nr:F-box/LRR-repeat protein 4 [Porphyridium purpureum]|eukprot:POR2069..scf295_1